ncbi:hypothetical protein DXG01_004086 [Tephrocybe rancida]|nr:hypothetical protein DXG01_004086 [Tephrocybe rancida]
MEIERETRLAAEYEEVEHQRDAHHIAGVLSQQWPPRPRSPLLPPISTFPEPTVDASQPGEPLFLAGSSADDTPFPAPPEDDQDSSDPVDDVSGCSSPALVALTSLTPDFGGVGTVWELTLVPQGLFFDAMQAVRAQDPSQEWCILMAPSAGGESWGGPWTGSWVNSQQHHDSHDPLATFDKLRAWWTDLRTPDPSSSPRVPPVHPLPVSILGPRSPLQAPKILKRVCSLSPSSSGARKSTRVAKSHHADKEKTQGGGPTEPLTIRFHLPDRLRHCEPLQLTTTLPPGPEDPPALSLIPPQSVAYDAVSRAPLPPFGAPFLLLDSAPALELHAPMLQAPSSPWSRPWTPLSGGGWSLPCDEQMPEDHFAGFSSAEEPPASPMAGMDASMPLDHTMDTVGGGSGSGVADLDVLALWELVVRQAAILETFEEDCRREWEALENEL